MRTAPAGSLLHWPLTAGVVVRERLYEPGSVIERHAHAHTTLILVLEGSFQEECDGRLVPRRPGELHVLPGGMLHTTRVSEAGARTFLIGLYDDWLTRSRERRLAVARPLSTAPGTRPAELARQMHDECQSRDAAAGLSLEGLLLETLATLMRMQSRPASHGMPRWLSEARDQLHDHFADPPPVADLAAGAGVSTAHFFRAFRTHFGCTPGDFVRRTRIRYVKRELRASREPISRIAYAAGFGDQAHLTRSFRAMVGVTPGAYRRLHAQTRLTD